jgi:hypothetical protein
MVRDRSRSVYLFAEQLQLALSALGENDGLSTPNAMSAAAATLINVSIDQLRVGFATALGVVGAWSERRTEHTERDCRRHRNFNHCKHIISLWRRHPAACPSLEQRYQALRSARRNPTTRAGFQIVGRP